MKKSTKISVIAFVVLILVAVPIYFYMRQNAGPEDAIQVKGAVNNPVNVTVSELRTFSSVTVQVTLTSSSKPEDNGVFSYTGVPIRDLLEQANLLEHASSVYVQASDGYGITLSLQEVMQNQHLIIAYEREGKPLEPQTEGGRR